MLNVLVDEFPTTAEIEGTTFALNTDFRFSLSTLLAFEDPDLTTLERSTIMLQNLFGDRVPDNVEKALETCQWFLNCGSTVTEEESSGRRLFSWSKDANFILAAFSATHGVDLQTVEMHWWRFYALFMDLGQDTTFCAMTALRKKYYAGKCTPEERAAIRDMGSVFEVPDSTIYTLEEQELIQTLKDRYNKARNS